MNKYTAEYDNAAVTPSVGTGAVGRVGGSDDDSFAREDGAEARGAVGGVAQDVGQQDVGQQGSAQVSVERARPE